jgi:hypothetical protein
MKRLLIVMLSSTLIIACSKISFEVNPVDLQTENVQLSLSNAEQAEVCTTSNCPSDKIFEAKFGCTIDSIPCEVPPNPPNGASLITGSLTIDAPELILRTKKPPKPISDEILAMVLDGTRFNNFAITNNSNTISRIRYVIFDVKKPTEVLYENFLIPQQQNSYFKSGDPNLSVTESALLNYKNSPTTAKRKIILKQIFDQFNTTTKVLSVAKIN